MRTSSEAERRQAPRAGIRLLDLLVLLTVLVLAGFGTWQLQRLQWKEGLIAHRTAQLQAPPVALPTELDDWAAYDFRKVEVSGRWLHEQEQLFGISKHDGRLGRQVLTPLVRADGRPVLVDRGWVPEDATHPAARRAGQVKGEVTVSGIARYREDGGAGMFAPANQPDEAIWYTYDLPALRDATGLDLLPVVVEADANANPGDLPVGGRTRVELPNRHLQYVVTWYGLALTLIAVYIAFRLKRTREGE